MLLPEPQAFVPGRKEAVSVTWAPPSPSKAPVSGAAPDADRDRWAPPSRSARPIYQPPGPPRGPL